MQVGRCHSFLNSWFSGSMLIFQGCTVSMFTTAFDFFNQKVAFGRWDRDRCRSWGESCGSWRRSGYRYLIGIPSHSTHTYGKFLWMRFPSILAWKASNMSSHFSNEVKDTQKNMGQIKGGMLEHSTSRMIYFTAKLKGNSLPIFLNRGSSNHPHGI